jgi:hypothetical protein
LFSEVADSVTCNGSGDCVSLLREPDAQIRTSGSMSGVWNRDRVEGADPIRALEKVWATYRKEYQLDPEGKLSAGFSECCPH